MKFDLVMFIESIFKHNHIQHLNKNILIVLYNIFANESRITTQKNERNHWNYQNRLYIAKIGVDLEMTLEGHRL